MNLPYKTLNQKRDNYNADLIKELNDFYTGGYQLLANSRSYLTKDIAENQQRFQDRVKTSAYINHLAQVIDYFASNLFSKEMVVLPAADSEDDTTLGEDTKDPFYQQFSATADLGHCSFSDIMQQAITNAMLHKETFIQIDFPSVDDMPMSAIDATDPNLPYLSIIPNECVIDFNKDECGNFTFFIIKREVVSRKTFLDSRDTKVIQFKVWNQDESGAVNWMIFESKPMKIEKQPSDTDEMTLVSEGTTTFKTIPVVAMCVNDGLWIGNKIGPLSREHFNRRSALIASQAKSLFCVPYAKLGSEIGAQGMNVPYPSEIQQNPNRADDLKTEALHQKGYVVLGSGDELGYLEPSGAAYTIVNEQINELVEQMMMIVSQMANSVAANSSALARSGLSKMADQKSTEIILSAYGKCVRECAKAIYRIISEARGETIVWDVLGLSNYEFTDRAQLLAEYLGVENVNIGSKTFDVQYRQKLAAALMGNCSPETMIQINNEIKKSVEASEHDLESDQEDASEPSEEPEDTNPPPDANDASQAKPSAPMTKKA